MPNSTSRVRVDTEILVFVFQTPSHVLPFSDGNEVSILVSLRLLFNTVQEESLELRNSEEGNGHAYLNVASHKRLNILPSELDKAVLKDLKEQLLVELCDLDLLLLDSLILEVFKATLLRLIRWIYQMFRFDGI